MLNTAGGVTGGDEFAYRIEAEAGGCLSLATQTAERAYRAQPGQTGQILTHLTAQQTARIDWLPQETILFDGCSLSRKLDVELSDQSTLLAVEPLVLGRKAMGERLNHIFFSDTWRIRQNGRLVFADSLRLKGPGVELINRPAVLAGAGAMATILLVAETADRHLSALRYVLPDHAGASIVRPGVLVARIVAMDGFALRTALIPIVELLRGAPLPTVWKM
ncbi:MAG: urease accessory protein UreD [Pseudomonadota bacterium]